MLERFPGTTGSLGRAISRRSSRRHHPGYRYVLGSVLNQVLPHQSVIGLKCKTALDKYHIKPDIIIGRAEAAPTGGLIALVGEKLRGEADYRIIGSSRSPPDLYPREICI